MKQSKARCARVKHAYACQTAQPFGERQTIVTLACLRLSRQILTAFVSNVRFAHVKLALTCRQTIVSILQQCLTVRQRRAVWQPRSKNRRFDNRLTLLFQKGYFLNIIYLWSSASRGSGTLWSSANSAEGANHPTPWTLNPIPYFCEQRHRREWAKFSCLNIVFFE